MPCYRFRRRLIARLNTITFSVLSAFLLVISANFAEARISFEALRRDGYGVVELQRPEPNTLTVAAMINGRKARLIVDTGWGDDGITVDASYQKVLRSPVTAAKQFGFSATGAPLGGMSKGVADVVSLGNIQIRQVPLYTGKIGALEHGTNRRVGATGFIGCGFLQTCSAIVDLHNLQLYLRPPGTGRRAIIGGAMQAQGLNEIPLTFGNHNCFVPVEINGARGAMIVDTGAYFAGVDRRFVPQMNAKMRSARARSVDAAGVESATSLTDLKSFRIANVPVYAPDLRIGTFGFYNRSKGQIIGLLGMDILGKNGTVIDFGQKKLYLFGRVPRKPAPGNRRAALGKGRSENSGI